MFDESIITDIKELRNKYIERNATTGEKIYFIFAKDLQKIINKYEQAKEHLEREVI